MSLAKLVLTLTLLAPLAVARQASPPPAWTIDGAQAGAAFGYSVSTAGDVNGDGYGDVIVGARTFDGAQTDEGRAYLYLGGPAGLAAVPAWTADGGQAGARFAQSVSTAGDVDGDGFCDVVIGANLFDAGEVDEGAAFLYLGSPAGLGATPAWSVQGDQTGAELGYSVSWAGDVNGDGYDDVVVGARLFDGVALDEGQARLYLGGPSGLAATPAAVYAVGQASAELGWSVATAGDVDADGFDDVIVGARLWDAPAIDAGAAFVFLGGASPDGIVDWSATGDQSGARFGWSVRTAGDVNADGYADVVVGAPYRTDALLEVGAAYVYFGSAAGLSSLASWTAFGAEEYGHFGWTVSTVGDTDGDGIADLAVAERHADAGLEVDSGRAYLYRGSTQGLADIADEVYDGDQSNAAFGWSLAPAGDVDGDGLGDLIIGDHRHDGVAGIDEGRAQLFAGSLVPRLGTWVPTFEGVGFSTNPTGQWVRGAGDFDGDGRSDLVVTDECNACTWGAEPGAYAVVFPGRDDGSLVAGWTLAGVWPGSTVAAGDVTGDGYDDLLARRDGFLELDPGGPTGLADTPAFQITGEVAIPAGDFNGDGYGDVLAFSSSPGTSSIFRRRLLLGSPAGWFEAWQDLGYNDLTDCCAADVDGDGFTDVLLPVPGGVTVVGGNPDGAFVVSDSIGDPATEVRTVGDVNGDGYEDVLHVLGSPPLVTTLYLGSATGDLVSFGTLDEPDIDGFLPAGDADGDGYADLLALRDSPTSQTLRWEFRRGSSDGPIVPPIPADFTVLMYWGSSPSASFVGGAQKPVPAGDFDGDGAPDFAYAVNETYIDDTDPWNRVYYYRSSSLLERPLAGEASAYGVSQRKPSDEPIALLGSTGEAGVVRLRASLRRDAPTPAGRSKVRVEGEVRTTDAPFDGPLFASSFVDSGTPGSLAEVSADSGPLAFDAVYKWRARLATCNPYFPHGRWLSVPSRSQSEWKLRASLPEPGAAVCFGDTSGACPCGNDSPIPGRGCLHSGDVGMYVVASGSTRLTADDLTLTAVDVPLGNTGIFYCGQTAVSNFLFDGIQCTAGNVLRFRGQLATTTTVSDTGFVAQALFPGFWNAGTSYYFQYFTRDNQTGMPSPCGGFANLSAAYVVTMTP